MINFRYQKKINTYFWGAQFSSVCSGYADDEPSIIWPQGVYKEKEIIALKKTVDLSLTRGMKT